MRNGGRITTALLLAVAFCATAHSALAETEPAAADQDSYILAAFARPAPAQPAPAQLISEQPPSGQPTQDPARFLLFSTSDLWRHGGFSHGGVLWAPTGLEQDGPVLKLLFGGGIYHYVSGALGNSDVRGAELAAAILPGWRFIHNGLSVTVFLGYDFQRHSLRPDDPSAGLRGNYHGARTGFELWYQPTPTTMIAADAALSSVGPSYNARLAAGLRAFDAFYVGPEVQAFGADGNYHQLRAGLHVTGLRTGAFEWSVGAGWATDTDDRSSAYGKLSIWTRH
jgi:hypothetical protein